MFFNKNINKISKITILPILFTTIIFVLLMPGVTRYIIGYPIVFLETYLNNLNYKIIKEKLQQTSNSEVISMDMDDGHVNAMINVKGKGPMLFIDIREEQFNNSSNLYLGRIGRWRIDSACYKKGEYSGSGEFNIGIAGKASAFFPFKMHNINNVINHYNEILTIIQKWPRYSSGVRVLGQHNKIIEKDKECYFGIEDATPPSHSN